MKIQIIQLESHDDSLSTRDKMGWSQTGQILLVWPPRGRILNRKLDLLLLQRHSKSLGVKLAIVSNDSEVIHNAEQLGLPVFENTRQALDTPWRGKRRRIVRIRREQPLPDLDTLRERSKQMPGKWENHPGVRIFAFLISLTALLAIVSLFIPSAELKLSPRRKLQEINMKVIGSPVFTIINIAGEIPLQNVTVIVEGNDLITTTGSLQFPDKHAIGAVRFTNLTEEDIDIPEGTIVSTLGSNPIRFATTRSGQLMGGIGKNTMVSTKALLPGEVGNVLEDSLLAIEGPLGLRIAATNPMPTHGGSDKLVPAASAKDKATLNKQLQSTLRETALAELKQNQHPGDILLEDSLVLSEIIERKFDPSENQPANTIELNLRIKFEAFIARGRDIENLAIQVLDANLPDQYIPVQETLIVNHSSQPTFIDEEIYEWEMILFRDTVANIDDGNAINQILGLNLSQASQRLSDSFDLRNTPDISIEPYWWPRLPYLPFRIQISQSETS